MSVPEIKIDGEANILNRPIGVRFSTAQLENAQARADALGRLNRSFTKGKSNIYGMLGEEIVANFVAGTVADTYDYDIVDPSGLKIDVKTKKTTSCEAPASHFTATVWGGNTKQKCDAYVFVRVCTDLDKRLAWICGWMPKNEFYETAIEYKRGQVDRENGYKVHADCWNVRIDRLHRLEEFDPWQM